MFGCHDCLRGDKKPGKLGITKMNQFFFPEVRPEKHDTFSRLKSGARSFCHINLGKVWLESELKGLVGIVGLTAASC